MKKSLLALVAVLAMLIGMVSVCGFASAETPTVSVNPTSGPVGTTFSFTCDAGYTIEIYKNGGYVADAVSNSYQPTEVGTYTAMITNDDGDTYPASVNFTVEAAPVKSISASKTTLEVGETISFTCTNTDKKDWVAIYKGDYTTGHPEPMSGYVHYKYHNESPSYTPTEAGTYTAMLLEDNGYDNILDRVVFKVRGEDDKLISADKTEMKVGETITFTCKGNPNWIGYYKGDWSVDLPEKLNAPYLLEYDYCSSTMSYTPVEVGTYTALLFADGGYDNILDRFVFEVKAAEEGKPTVVIFWDPAVAESGDGLTQATPVKTLLEAVKLADTTPGSTRTINLTNWGTISDGSFDVSSYAWTEPITLLGNNRAFWNRSFAFGGPMIMDNVNINGNGVVKIYANQHKLVMKNCNTNGGNGSGQLQVRVYAGLNNNATNASAGNELDVTISGDKTSLQNVYMAPVVQPTTAISCAIVPHVTITGGAKVNMLNCSCYNLNGEGVSYTWENPFVATISGGASVEKLIIGAEANGNNKSTGYFFKKGLTALVDGKDSALKKVYSQSYYNAPRISNSFNVIYTNGANTETAFDAGTPNADGFILEGEYNNIKGTVQGYISGGAQYILRCAENGDITVTDKAGAFALPAGKYATASKGDVTVASEGGLLTLPSAGVWTVKFGYDDAETVTSAVSNCSIGELTTETYADGTVGLGFVNTLTLEEGNKIGGKEVKEIGFIVATKKNAAESGLVLENVDGKKFLKGTYDSIGSGDYNVKFCGIPESQINTAICGRLYMILDDGSVVYNATTETSFADLFNALQDHSQFSEEIKGWFAE